MLSPIHSHVFYILLVIEKHPDLRLQSDTWLIYVVQNQLSNSATDKLPILDQNTP